MAIAPNAAQARDIASIAHPRTALAHNMRHGSMVTGRDRVRHGCEHSGTQFPDAAAASLRACLGHAPRRLARVACDRRRAISRSQVWLTNLRPPRHGDDVVVSFINGRPRPRNTP